MKHYPVILLFIFISIGLIINEFQEKDGYKLELQTPKTIELFASTKRLIGNTKNGENLPSQY